jgi:hypothetical protein
MNDLVYLTSPEMDLVISGALYEVMREVLAFMGLKETYESV